ncbi:MAG: HAD hydrolase-like protein [Phycisphaerae bacterium]|nr:HAD hydrolase-like protein [Phycisphaerae bacterium]
MNNARAILFDLDGTLIDSLPDINDALNRALLDAGLSRAKERDVRAWIGDGIETLCRRALIAQTAEHRLNDVLTHMSAAYEAAPANRTTCFRNILEMLDLTISKNLLTAVLTNKPHALAVRILDAMLLSSRLRAVRGYVCESDKKPSPTHALSIARELSVEPSQCVIVGDSPVDIQTARNAQMRAIAVSWGYRDRDELIAARPDALIDDPSELIELLEQVP